MSEQPKDDLDELVSFILDRSNVRIDKEQSITISGKVSIADILRKVKAIRSRPHPAPQAQDEYTGEIACQAREDVLKTFTKLWRDNYCPEPTKACHADDGKDYCPICILKESLRHHSEQQEQPDEKSDKQTRRGDEVRDALGFFN